jgi:hypothetical protein
MSETNEQSETEVCAAPAKLCPGCGSSNITEPDDEDLIDCCKCGIWFSAGDAITAVECATESNQLTAAG